MIFYEIYRRGLVDQKFRGYACQAWMESVKTVGFWSFTFDTISSSRPVIQSPTDCWAMIRTGFCKENQLINERKFWHFQRVPAPDYRHWQTIEESALNCRYD